MTEEPEKFELRSAINGAAEATEQLKDRLEVMSKETIELQR